MALNDCAAITSFEVIDTTLTISSVSISAQLFTQGGVALPGLGATWAAPSNPYVTGIQFEYQETGLGAGAVRTDPQGIALLSWSSTNGLIAGKTYATRWRAVGVGAFGSWSSASNITLSSTFTSQSNVIGYLTDEAQLVPAANDGTIVLADLTAAGGTFKVLNGLTDVTTSSAFIVVGGATVGGNSELTTSGLKISINLTTGVYTLSAASTVAWNVDRVTFTLRATFGGVSIDKVYTIAKSKVGITGTSAVSGYLTNEAQSVATNADGTGGTFTGAGGTFKIFDGTTDKTGTAGSVAYTVVGGAVNGANHELTSNGLKMSINMTTGVFTLSLNSAWTTDAQNFTLQAVYATIPIQKTYAISKSKTGANSPTLYVYADRQLISYAFGTAGSLTPTPTSQTTTFTANRVNAISGTVGWTVADLAGNTTYTPVGGSPTALNTLLSATTGNSVTITAANFDIARNGTEGITVTASLTTTDSSGASVTATDKITVSRSGVGASGPVMGLYPARMAITYDASGAANPSTQDNLFSVQHQQVSTSALASHQFFRDDGTLATTTAQTAVTGAGTGGINRLLWSTDLSNAAWTALGVTTTANNALAPDGQTTATLISVANDGIDQVHGVKQSGLTTANTQNICTFHGKRNSAALRYMWVYTADVAGFVVLDLATGLVVNSDLTGISNFWVSSLPNGFYRVDLRWTSPVAQAVDCFAVLSTSPTAKNYAPAAAVSGWLWGGQMMNGVTSPQGLAYTQGATARAATGDSFTMTAAQFATLLGSSKYLVCRTVLLDFAQGSELFDVVTIVKASDGATQQTIFKRSLTTPSTPTGNFVSGVTPTGWTDGPPADDGTYLWASKGTISASGTLIGAWSTPVRVDGDSVANFTTVITGTTPGNVTVKGRVFKKTGGSGAWSANVGSAEAYLGGCGCSFKAAAANTQLIAGLTDAAPSSAPSTDHHATIHWGISPQTNGTFLILEVGVDKTSAALTAYNAANGTSLTSFAYAAGDRFQVIYNDGSVKYYQNANLIYTSATKPTTGVATYFDSAFFTLNAEIDDVSFGATGAVGLRTDFKFMRSASQPATPTGDAPSGWSDGIPAGSGAIWEISGTKNGNGNLVGGWSTPQAITGLNSRGAYNATTTYYTNDVVTYSGGSYVYTASTGTSGNAPSGTDQPNAYWDVLAAPATTAGSGSQTLTATVSSVQSAGINFRTLANAQGYTGGDLTLTVNINANVTGLSGGGVGVDSGTWPAGKTINITINVALGVFVRGGGGAGGGGGGFGGAGGGGAGGDAFYLRIAISGGIVNAGTIQGGGGGAGGGGHKVTYSGGEPTISGGGGGGGGFPNGAGGAGGRGDSGTATSGSAGTTSGGGSGGAGTGGGATGGTGGGAASAGASGGSSTYSGGAGGAAGFAVRLNGFTCSVTGAGTTTGSVA